MEFVKLDPKTGVFHFRENDGRPLHLVSEGAMDCACANYRKEIEELKDFCVWLTGCGYDFCKHEYFCKMRDKLLKGK
ncbi:MAG: hypothetical protein GY861_03745 [bacterium]|nr:hypothetical protein [bacterium]